jgi:hypothetical protein
VKRLDAGLASGDAAFEGPGLGGGAVGERVAAVAGAACVELGVGCGAVAPHPTTTVASAVQIAARSTTASAAVSVGVRREQRDV